MRTLLPLALLLAMATGCKKEDVRTVRYKVECARCTIEYADANGQRTTVAVNGAWEKSLRMESGTAVYMSGCSYNNPVGGSVNNLLPLTGHSMLVFVDSEPWSTFSESSWVSAIDSVQVTATQWRKFYSDTCAVLSGTVPEK